jgi:N-formylglutamate amidohydrolase
MPRMPGVLLGLLLCSWLPSHSAAAPPAAKPAIDRSLITVQRGDLPIILSSPHGGRLAIPGVEERTNQGATRFVTVRDENTAELTETALAEVQRRTGRKPYVVIARFERKYLDVNREAQDAYESEISRAYYEAYHQSLADFCREVQKKWRGGLLLDIHGQKSHPDNLLRGTNNGRTDVLLRQRLGTGAVVGPHSILGMMDHAGYHVLPKLGSNDPEIKNYTGGETVKAHGSHVADGIDAIQLEFGSTFRIPKSAAVKSGQDLAAAIEAFCQEYFPQALPAAVPSR